MDEIELICKCGGELSPCYVGWHCNDCDFLWTEVYDWMKPAPREFSPAQQAIIDAAHADDNSPRHVNCDGAPDGGHSAECRASEK